VRARDLAPQPVGDLAGAFLFGSFSARSTSQDRSPYCAELLKWLFCVYNTRGFAAIMFASHFAAHQPTFAPFDKHLASIPLDTFDSFIRCHTIQFLLLLFHYRIFNSLSLKSHIHQEILRATIQLQSLILSDPFTYFNPIFIFLNFKHLFKHLSRCA